MTREPSSSSQEIAPQPDPPAPAEEPEGPVPGPGARRALWMLAAVLPSTIALRGMFSTSEIFYYRDLIMYFWPLHLWFRRTIAAGVFPLWDEFVGLGQSAIADPTRHLLFPPVLLCRLLFPEALGFNLSVGLAFPTAAIGTWLLARREVGPAAATIAAILYSASAPLISSGNDPNFSWCVALAPWSLWALWRLADAPTGGRFALAAALVGLEALAGQPVTLAAMSAIAMFRALTAAEGWRDAVRRASLTAGALGAAFLLVAWQFVPLAAAAARSDRGGGSVDTSFWSLHPLRLLEVIVPSPFASSAWVPASYFPWVTALNSDREPLLLSLYVGGGAVILAAIGLTCAPRRRALLWGAVLAGALVSAFGSRTPIYPVLKILLPFLHIFRYPEKYVIFAGLALAMLGAEGWEALATSARRRVVTAAAVAAGAMGLAVVGVYTGAGLLADAVGVPPAGVPELQGGVVEGALRLAAVALGVVALVALTPRRPRLAQVGLFVILTADLLGGSAWLSPSVNVAFADVPPPLLTTVGTDARVYVGGRGNRFSDPSLRKDDLPSSLNLPSAVPVGAGEAIYQIRTLVGPSGRGVREVISADLCQLYPRTYSDLVDVFYASAPAARARFLERVGVRMQILAKPPADYDEREPIEWLDPIAIYRSDAPFSRTAIVERAVVERDTGRATRSLFEAGFDPSAVALVDRETEPTGTAGPPDPPSARIVSDRTNEVVVDAHSGGNATLVLFDSYAPAWRAEVDGREAPVVRVDGLFRGVRLAPGRHEVRFYYSPPELLWGIAISCAVGLGLVALAVAPRWSARRSRTPRPA